MSKRIISSLLKLCFTKIKNIISNVRVNNSDNGDKIIIFQTAEILSQIIDDGIGAYKIFDSYGVEYQHWNNDFVVWCVSKAPNLNLHEVIKTYKLINNGFSTLNQAIDECRKKIFYLKTI